MTEYLGTGDPTRSLSLLWGRLTPSTRGPAAGSTPGEIAAAAIRLGDEGGLDAVSMRKVAERLGRSTMSLYTYVRSKAELLELMLDTVLGELPLEYDRSDGWRAAAETCAREVWSFYERHPWVLQIADTRATLGPNETASYESQLRIFDDLGLSGLDMTRLVGVLGSFVRGSASSVANARAAEHATGISDDDWWRARTSVLDDVVGEDYATRFPTVTKLQAQEQTFDEPWDGEIVGSYMETVARDTFEFGLARLLDGIEAFLDARS